MEKKSISTPISTPCSLDKDEVGKVVEEIKNWDIVGSLCYLVASCHNIVLVVCLWHVFKQTPMNISHILRSNAL